jgi:hypothetical protein
MKRILSIMLIISLVFLIACQPVVEDNLEDSTETEPASSEEAEINDALDDLNEFEDLGAELEEDINFDDLEDLDFE